MLRALIDYGDDSEDDSNDEKRAIDACAPASCLTKRKNDSPHLPTSPPKKLKALPTLDSALFTPAPIDDSSKHQGRKRTIPLSRPVPLRAHQRDDFRKEVRKAALERTQFLASFAQITTLTNEDQSRKFLCVEIGAGHKEFQELSQSLSSHLALLRQLPYYPQPRFHISIAWMLTHHSSNSVPAERDQYTSSSSIENESNTREHKPDSTTNAATNDDPLVKNLQAKFSKQLLSLGSGRILFQLPALSLQQTGEQMDAPKDATRECLPLTIKLPCGFSVASITEYVSELKAFLASPLVESLVSAHPNEVAIKVLLTRRYEKLFQDQELHPSLRQLIRRISQLRLPRALEDIHGILPGSSIQSNSGMSPKKAHEVQRLSDLINMIYNTSIGGPNRLIVDVGAGQGYLSRKLAGHTGTRVLALDGDKGQTEGATLRGKGLSHAERQRARNREGTLPDEENADPVAPPVTHRTLFITSDSLLHAIDEWIERLDVDQGTTPCPVLITGLHACGSLTPAVLRCFIDLCTRFGQEVANKRRWAPVGLALVGCCYNLMHNSGDFPLSETTPHNAPLNGLDLKAK
ncbi:unnamed protein product [Rhizoctonia solani]|uniref:Methyltransferase domain-containing protein n=1 Tax=Rhizoctonia solani TaxID=456999 RepID=A0A8H3A1D6_9AGAM|nr:unnamed protein product [Rhizoctonia solani]